MIDDWDRRSRLIVISDDYKKFNKEETVLHYLTFRGDGPD